MKDVVVPIDYSSDVARIAGQAIARYRRDPVRIHLLNVQRPLPRHVSQFFASADLRDYHHECGMRLLQEAVALLDAAEVPHRDHVLVGKPAEEIVRFADERPGAELLLDDEPESVLAVLGLGSIGSQVRRLMTANLPVATAQDPTSAT
jgi:hypothetical protein